MKRAAAVLIFLLSACGDSRPQPDFFVEGIGVKVETKATWATAEALAVQIPETIKAVAAYAGHNPDDLRGWVIVFTDADVQCSPLEEAIGCQYASGWIAVNVQGQNCAAGTVLPHELLHAFIGDSCHASHLWTEWAPVEAALHTDTCYAPANHWMKWPGC